MHNNDAGINVTKCPMHEHQVCRTPECKATGCVEERKVAHAKELTEKVLQSIEGLTGHQQTKIIECGMRLRELAAYYGPYFRYALSLTSCEVASGALILPYEAECDRVIEHEVQKLIIPGNNAQH